MKEETTSQQPFPASGFFTKPKKHHKLSWEMNPRYVCDHQSNQLPEPIKTDQTNILLRSICTGVSPSATSTPKSSKKSVKRLISDSSLTTTTTTTTPVPVPIMEEQIQDEDQEVEEEEETKRRKLHEEHH